MQPKTAILDIAGGIAAKAGAPRLGARLQEAHEGLGRRLDHLLQQDFPASTSGVHIPMPMIEGGKLRLAPWTKDRQAHVRQTIAYNPEAMPAVVAPIPGAEVGYLGAKALARRAAGVPLTGVPNAAISFREVAAPAVRPAVQAVQGAAGRVRRSLRDFIAQEGSMPGKLGSAPEFRGRDRSAAFSTGVEKANIQSGNAVLDGLFARKAEMADRTEKQLSALFRNKSYGRNRALGPTADEASSYFERARSSGALG